MVRGRESHGSYKQRDANVSDQELNTPLFAEDMILYIENPKNATSKLLELINDLVKLQDTKLMHRNLLHSYTLMMKNLKEKLWEHSHLPLQQK